MAPRPFPRHVPHDPCTQRFRHPSIQQALDLFLVRLQQEIGLADEAVEGLVKGDSSQLVALGKQGSLSLA